MPARSARMYLVPQAHGTARVLPFPSWWRSADFFSVYGGRAVDTGSPFAVDYGCLLTAGEALAWSRESGERLAGEPGARPPAASQVAELETALASAVWVVVESYEWESGLE